MSILPVISNISQIIIVNTNFKSYLATEIQRIIDSTIITFKGTVSKNGQRENLH